MFIKLKGKSVEVNIKRSMISHYRISSGKRLKLFMQSGIEVIVPQECVDQFLEEVAKDGGPQKKTALIPKEIQDKIHTTKEEKKVPAKATALMQCVCGKVCAAKVGLNSHQRHCQMFKDSQPKV